MEVAGECGDATLSGRVIAEDRRLSCELRRVHPLRPCFESTQRIAVWGDARRVGSIPVIRGAGEDRFGAVDLLEGHEQSEFVLECLRAKGPEKIGAGSCGLIPATGGSHEQGETGNRAVAELLDFGGKCATGEGFSAFIEKHAVATFRKLEHPLVQAGPYFNEVTLDLGKRPQSAEVFLNACFGKIERGPAGGDDFPGQR